MKRATWNGVIRLIMENKITSVKIAVVDRDGNFVLCSQTGEYLARTATKAMEIVQEKIKS